VSDALFRAGRRESPFGFVGNPLDRISDKREDEAVLAALRARPDARAILLCRDTPILASAAGGLDPMFALSAANALGPVRETALLGVFPDGAPVFALLLDDGAIEQHADTSDGFLDRRVLVVPGRPDLKLIDLRSIAVQGLVSGEILGMLAQAKAALHWHARHSHCANCGARTRSAAAGWRRECDACKAQHFPRTDPVVIMLAVSGDQCLLGRQARFPNGMYSCLAGFLEPGESIEEAVRREILEEAGVTCGDVAYLASQPWPFPASLMIGCVAQATSHAVAIDGNELEDARWFTREEARAMLAGAHAGGLIAPTKMAIAHHILRAWAEG